MKNNCFFCDIQKKKDNKIINDNQSFFSRYDDFPITIGHCEIITKNHIISFFELNHKQIIDFYELLQKTKSIIDNKFSPDGYNIGINEGDVAGRTQNHLHIHLIPRFLGDVKNPVGGVRNIIPKKANYVSKAKKIQEKRKYFT